MKIALDKNFSIEWDGNSFQLIHHRIIKAGPKTQEENVGKTTEKVLGYYGSLLHVLEGYMKQDIGLSELESMTEVIERIVGYEKRLEEVFGHLGIDVKKRYEENEAKKAAEAKAEEERKAKVKAAAQEATNA